MNTEDSSTEVILRDSDGSLNRTELQNIPDLALWFPCPVFPWTHQGIKTGRMVGVAAIFHVVDQCRRFLKAKSGFDSI